jgi:uncharacterized protein YkwD
MSRCDYCDTTAAKTTPCDTCGGEFCGAHLSGADHECVGLMMRSDGGPTAPGAEGGTAVVSAASELTSPSTDDGTQMQAPGLPRRVRAAVVRGGRGLSLLALLAAVAVVAAGVTSFAAPVATPALADVLSTAGVDAGLDGVDEREVERLVREEVRDSRAGAGVGDVTTDPALSDIARQHSADMAAAGYVGHDGPDGQSVNQRYANVGDRCAAADGSGFGGGEVVLQTHYGQDVQVGDGVERYDTPAGLATGIVDALLRSDSRRTVLLDRGWSAIGVGVTVTPDGAVYATLNFC